MRRMIAYIAAAGLASFLVTTASAPAGARISTWKGRVVHVSVQNIKVYNPTGGVTLSFLLIPKFKQVFSDDGKTTYQMASIQPGMDVRVIYDQGFLGARHADKIFVVNAHGHTLKTMKT